jgi:hypothetical protein
MGKFIRVGSCTLLLLLLLVVVQPAAGADETAADMREEIETLKRTVENLEKRLLELEGGHDNTLDPISPAQSQDPPEPTPPSFPVMPEGLSKSQEKTIRVQWKKMKRDLTEEEVEALLGSPKDIVDIRGQKIWYYQYDKTGSTVIFNRDGRVIGWQKPPFGLLW